MSHECQRCGATKPAAEMVKRGGKPSKTCIECFRTAMAARGGRKRKSNGDATPKARKARQAEVVQEPVTIDGPSLEVLPGFGFRSSVEGDMLTQPERITRPAILVDLYEGEIDEPYKPWRPGDDDDNDDDNDDE